MKTLRPLSRRDFVTRLPVAAAALSLPQVVRGEVSAPSPEQLKTGTYLHPKSLAPDPTYAEAAVPLNSLQEELSVYPHRLVRAAPPSTDVIEWGRRLSLRHDPGPIALPADENGQAQLLVDFGTELEASLEVEVDVSGVGAIVVAWGESVAEAESWGVASDANRQLPAKELWNFDAAGQQIRVFPSRGFRYVRLHSFDMASVTVLRLRSRARFTFTQRIGDFLCDDPLFQRAWQSSLYTARLCTFPTAFWDGIKRDRVGWFGDARITKETVDSVYFNPEPSLAMMNDLPEDSWANGIPGYTFDCVAMLRQHCERFGVEDPRVADVFGKIRRTLSWVEETQTDPGSGWLVRCEDQHYFFDIGFLDWSPMPVGGRFEELSWLQCSYVEGLRNVALVARWLGDTAAADGWNLRADRLTERIRATFWDDTVGMRHTLNTADPDPMRQPEGQNYHYRKSYVENARFGPSGTSRQASARAVWAGVLTPEMKKVALRTAFLNPAVAPIITPYYKFYEMHARAECGDPDGALKDMRDYVGDMLNRFDSATVWESYSPESRGFRALSLGSWPKSLCHGWSSGLVGLTFRHVLGIEILEPGFAKVDLRPRCRIPGAFSATVPTPLGVIKVERQSATEPTTYDIPAGIDVNAYGEGVVIQRTS